MILDKTNPPDAVIEELIGYAASARRNGLVALEDEALQVQDPFLRKALNLAVDGTDLQEIRNMMQLEIELPENQALAEARVFECAGGYSPTIGIIGAVMGLIQVMKNLANIEEVGHGIAVAFVATVYGVGLANVVLLPAATKIKARIESETGAQRTHAGRSGRHRGRNEPEIDSQQVGSLPARDQDWQQGRQAASPRKRGTPARPPCKERIMARAASTRDNTWSQSRELAGFLRGFHYAPLCVFCGHVRHRSNRQRQDPSRF